MSLGRLLELVKRPSALTDCSLVLWREPPATGLAESTAADALGLSASHTLAD